MPAQVQDLVIEQNATNVMVITVVGGPETLVGYAGEMDIRERKSDIVPLAELGEEMFTVNNSTRQVVLTIPSSVAADYAWTAGVYDLYVVGPGGDRWRLVEGRVRLSKTVTREGA